MDKKRLSFNMFMVLIQFIMLFVVSLGTVLNFPVTMTEIFLYGIFVAVWYKIFIDPSCVTLDKELEEIKIDKELEEIKNAKN